jgi:hypothetical protein
VKGDDDRAAGLESGGLRPSGRALRGPGRLNPPTSRAKSSLAE